MNTLSTLSIILYIIFIIVSLYTLSINALKSRSLDEALRIRNSRPDDSESFSADCGGGGMGTRIYYMAPQQMGYPMYNAISAPFCCCNNNGGGGGGGGPAGVGGGQGGRGRQVLGRGGRTSRTQRVSTFSRSTPSSGRSASNSNVQVINTSESRRGTDPII